jgi:hypothetical protein
MGKYAEDWNFRIRQRSIRSRASNHCSSAPHSPLKNEGELASFVGLRGTTQVSCDENNYIFTSRQPVEADLRIVGWKDMNIPCGWLLSRDKKLQWDHSLVPLCIKDLLAKLPEPSFDSTQFSSHHVMSKCSEPAILGSNFRVWLLTKGLWDYCR